MIIKAADHVEAYRARAKYGRNVHQLDGRGGRQTLTDFINRNIYEHVFLAPGDKLLDIGCGDGALLRLASERGIPDGLGLQGTEDEASRLRAEGLNVVQGFTDSLPVESGSMDVVVCNSVLLIVPREKILGSLQEIARVVKPNARIWIGEIPRTPELVDVPRQPTVSYSSTYQCYRNKGVGFEIAPFLNGP